MDARTIITRVRRGEALGLEACQWLAKGLASGTVGDAQGGAFAMAVCLNPLSIDDRVKLTLAMRDSGETLQWDLDGPVLDKHSTGGLGDCVSLVLAPLLAKAGIYVPMISGRGLGHTGGTLDKLASISGVRTDIDASTLKGILRDVGCAIVAATENIAPADRRLYAIRDVSATVDSLDLICSSILSKKLAAGLDGLILDVKCGSGAFMQTPEEARALARALVDTANAAGCRTSAVISDMNTPLAPAMGNALEVIEVMRVLTQGARGRLYDLSIELGARLLVDHGISKAPAEAREKLETLIATGKAAERFGRMIAAQGGPTAFEDSWTHLLPEAPVIKEVTAEYAGYISAWDGIALGLGVVDLGGGRHRQEDVINPAVGLSSIAGVGDYVDGGVPIATIHAARPEDAERMETVLKGAVRISDVKPDLTPLIFEDIR